MAALLSNAAKNLECASFGAKTTHARGAKSLKTETMDTHAAVVQALLQKIAMQISAAENLPVVTGMMTRAPQKTPASANRTASQYCVIRASTAAPTTHPPALMRSPSRTSPQASVGPARTPPPLQ